MELISKEDAMEAIRALKEVMLTNGEVINALYNVPTIESRPNGKWKRSVKAEWLVQDTSYWRPCHSHDVQVNRVNLKCSNCGFRNHKNIRYDNCPKCNAVMGGDTE